MKGGGCGPCEVRFVKREIAATELPDFSGYKKTLDKCLSDWEGKEETTHSYLKELERRASNKDIDLLLVFDNGIGFGNKSMNAILKEGSPDKLPGSTGSYGIGHLSAFGLSGVQYVLYGGKRDKESIAAGHAILATHKKSEGKPISSSHGFYVEKVKESEMFDRFDFVKNNGIVSPIADWLKEIEKQGSVVAITDFNYFNEKPDDDKLLYEIVKAVIVNFAIAVLNGNLQVSVSIGKKINKEVNAKNIDTLIDEFGLNDLDDVSVKGVLANIETYRNQDASGSLGAPFEDCEMILRNNARAHGVTIWRNGMLIKRNYRRLARSYFNTAVFDGLVLLDGKKPERTAHDLILKSENPLHNGIFPKRIDDKNDRDSLTDLFESTREWLTEKAEPLSEEILVLEDIQVGRPLVAKGASSIRRVVPEPRRVAPKPEKPTKKGKKTKKRKPTTQVRLQDIPISWSSIAVDQNVWRVKIAADEDIHLKIYFDLNLDFNVSSSKLTIEDCKHDSGEITLKEWNEDCVELLGKKDESCLLELTFALDQTESNFASLAPRIYSQKKNNS